MTSGASRSAVYADSRSGRHKQGAAELSYRGQRWGRGQGRGRGRGQG